ncbi:MAG: transposase [Dehalococcoidia bacterium]|nr:transposase [Dehalococcoidia bacterium]
MDNAASPRHRKILRLPAYDYRSAGAYFVTVCSFRRRPSLDAPEARAATRDAIPAHFPQARTDAFVIMPNHVHGIVWIVHERGVGARHASPLHPGDAHWPAWQPRGVPPGSLGAIVGSFKSAATKRINEILRTPGEKVWQRNYYERVIRDERELAAIREYIVLNPLKWHLDRENPERQPDMDWQERWSWLEEGLLV